MRTNVRGIHTMNERYQTDSHNHHTSQRQVGKRTGTQNNEDTAGKITESDNKIIQISFIQSRKLAKLQFSYGHPGE